MCSSEEYATPGNFAMIAKISLGLQKFRNHSKNFARIAKISLGLRKFRNPSEIEKFL